MVLKMRSVLTAYSGRSRGHFSMSAFKICRVTCTFLRDISVVLAGVKAYPMRTFHTSLMVRLSRKSPTFWSLLRLVLA
jgi:hypothetical protein